MLHIGIVDGKPPELGVELANEPLANVQIFRSRGTHGRLQQHHHKAALPQIHPVNFHADEIAFRQLIGALE